jgi:hypothetical protein
LKQIIISAKLLFSRYQGLIEVYDGYGIDAELPTKVDFIIYEPNPEARRLQRLKEEDSFMLKLIKEKHLKSPDEWERVLFL